MAIDFLKKMFSDRGYFRTLLIIAIPIVLQNLIASSLNMLDTVMVGKLGEAEIAAVGVGNQVFLLFNVMIMGLSGGCGIFIAQFWGRKDVKNIRRTMGVSLISGAVIASVFTSVIFLFSTQIVSVFNIDPDVIKHGSVYLKIVSLSYIFTAITFCLANASRSIEKALSPMIVSFIALICNATLNYVLIFGKFGFEPMGVKGAAVGTLISRGLEATILTLYVLKTNDVLIGKLSNLIDFSWDFVRKIYNIVLPVVLNDMFWAFGMVIYSVIYGRMGTQELAATQIYNTIQNLFTVLVLGVASSALVMIGNQIGSGNEERAKRYGYQFVVLGALIGVTISIVLALSTKSVVGIFDVSNDVRYFTEMILYITSLVLTFKSVSIIMIIGILRGGGDAKYALFVEMISMYGLGIPLALIGAFVLKLEVYWVVALISTEEILKLILVIKRLKTDKWIKNVS